MKFNGHNLRECASAAKQIMFLVTAGSVLGANEETSTPVAPSEYVIDAIEGSGDVGGSDAEPIDSQDVQTEAVEAGEADPGVTRRFRPVPLPLSARVVQESPRQSMLVPANCSPQPEVIEVE